VDDVVARQRLQPGNTLRREIFSKVVILMKFKVGRASDIFQVVSYD
jgi:hypothetical protein